MRGRLRTGWRGLVIATFVGASTLVATPTPASADFTAKQIFLCPTISIAFGGQAWNISGHDQNNNYVYYSPTPVNFPNAACVDLTGWWWQGYVNIWWYNADGSFAGANNCYVDPTPTNSAWVGCYPP